MLPPFFRGNLLRHQDVLTPLPRWERYQFCRRNDYGRVCMVYHRTIVTPSHGNLIIEDVNKLKSLSSKLIPHKTTMRYRNYQLQLLQVPFNLCNIDYDVCAKVPSYQGNMLVHLYEAKKKSSILYQLKNSISSPRDQEFPVLILTHYSPVLLFYTQKVF